MRQIFTYKVIDIKTGAFAHVEALNREEALHKVGKKYSDLVQKKVKVVKIGPGCRWQNFPKKSKKGAAYADFD